MKKDIPRETGSKKVYLTGIVILYLISGLMVQCFRSPEEVIIGKWKEVSWEYEKVDNKPANILSYKDLAQETLLRHESEHWEFGSDRKLTISRIGKENIVADYTLKGRGHLLKLTYDGGGKIEKYEIDELNDDELILIFTIDGFELRGIAKLTFKRVED